MHGSDAIVKLLCRTACAEKKREVVHVYVVEQNANVEFPVRGYHGECNRMARDSADKCCLRF
jgi:hypothetical protein